MTSRRSAARGESGAAVVEFTLVTIVLVTLFLAILQLGLVLHVRNTMVASLAEGARYAANADRGLGDGEIRARELIGEALSPRFARGVSSRYVQRGGVRLVEVSAATTLPLLGLLGPDRVLRVAGHAVDEEVVAP